MPMRNMGTLLENVVLVEALRAMLEADQRSVAQFANAFAMPPLSEWREHALGRCFAREGHLLLAAGERPEPGTYADLMWHCLQHRGDAGPNGALLCAALAAREGRRLR